MANLVATAKTSGADSVFKTYIFDEKPTLYEVIQEVSKDKANSFFGKSWGNGSKRHIRDIGFRVSEKLGPFKMLPLVNDPNFVIESRSYVMPPIPNSVVIVEFYKE